MRTRTPRPSHARTAGTSTADGMRFRILRLHRTGGLGAVYVAHDEELHREVALKEIRDRHAHDPDSRSRFVQEAEITGRLEHPGIVPVYGLGTYADGRPFYAMRFIKGDNLKDAIAHFHEADDAGRDPGERTLALRELLGRFLDVCNAMAYAHSRGILHRDLKPNNILLGPYGETLVVDWGLAKPVGRPEERVAHGGGDAAARFGRFGQRRRCPGDTPGTPAYMSPEQAAGDLDRLGLPSDVYSLGATLYCLLTGRPPFEDRDVVVVLGKVRRGEFPPPRAVNRAIDPALEAICLKAMALVPEGRYASPIALADDIEHWLADEPVSAWREPFSIRARRWMRRNRTLVASTAAVLVAGLISLAAFSTMVAGKNHELDAKNQQLMVKNRELDDRNQELDRQRQAAEDQRHRALKAEHIARDEETKTKKSEAETKAVLEFFQNRVLAAARPQDQEGGLGKDVTLRAAVDAAETGIEKTFADQPTAEASIRDSLGLSYLYLGEPALAIRQHELALALRRQAKLGPDHPDTLTSMNDLAVAYRAAGRLADALALHEETLKRRQAKLGPDHPDTLTSMNDLAVAYRAAGRLADAMPLSEETLKRRQAQLGPDHPYTLTAMNNLALAYGDAGRLTEALALHEEELKRCKAKLGPDHPDTLTSMNNLALAYGAAGRLTEALPLHEEELKRCKAKLGPDHPLTLTSMNNLAQAYGDAGRLSDALPLHEEELKRCKAKLGPDHPLTLTSMNNLALAYGAAGRLTEALALHEEELKRCKAKLGPDHPLTLTSMNNLAQAYGDAGRLSDALPLHEEELKRCKAKLGPDHPLTLTSMNNLALAYGAAGRLTEALALHEEELKRCKAKLGPDHPDTLTAMNSLAVAYAAAGRLTEALALHEEELKRCKAKLGPDHPDTLTAHEQPRPGVRGRGPVDRGPGPA